MPVTSKLRNPGSMTPRPSHSAFNTKAPSSTLRHEPLGRLGGPSDSAEAKRPGGYHGTLLADPKIRSAAALSDDSGRRSGGAELADGAGGGRGRRGRARQRGCRVVGLALEKADQPLAQLVKLRVVEHAVPLARPRQRHFHDLADVRARA